MFVFQAQLDIHHFVLTKHKIPLWFTPDGKFTVEVDNNHLTLVLWCIYITPQESNSHSPTSLFSPATLTSSLTVTPEEILCLYYTLQINSLLCALRILWCFGLLMHMSISRGRCALLFMLDKLMTVCLLPRRKSLF